MICRFGVRAAALAALLCSLAVAQTPATGLRPRGTAADYAASQQTPNGTFAASVIPADQVRKLFYPDISHDYLVFEFACYPADAHSINLNSKDFLIKAGTADADFVRPADASIVAAFTHRESLHPASGPDIVTDASIGYGSGIDPVTGRPVHGVYTGGDVGVGTGRDSAPVYAPRVPPVDRAALQTQLEDKALPQGDFTTPVAGYLYFSVGELKKAKGHYDLQYLNEAAGKVDLVLVSKRK